MKINQLSKEMIGNLRKLIGGQITSIFVEGGRILKGENMILDGGGMIYHYVGDFDDAGEYGGRYDYLAIIDIKTETGRRVIIEQDDPINTFYIHFDDLEMINSKLGEIHDDSGKTFGKKRYQLKHEIN